MNEPAERLGSRQLHGKHRCGDTREQISSPFEAWNRSAAKMK